MTRDEQIVAAAADVEVIDAAGRIIASPARNAPAASVAEVLALAWATEALNAVAIEAELLVRALQLPITGNDARDAARDQAIQTPLANLARQFTVMRAADETPTRKEDHDGRSHA